jgi:putative spermidine/putrescine transport system ATP-binding protein
MSDPQYLALRNITIAYGKTVAVNDVSITVPQGELLALLGPSGCGKTTLMRAIAGLLPLTSGNITLDKRDITRVPANKREVGLVFQSYALFPHLSVFENVAFGLRLRSISGDQLQQRVQGAIAMVGLQGFEKRLPKELSGGQQQRVALARSVVVRPNLLLLDEPLSNLDARLRLEMRSELHRLHRDLGVTMIYVTHDQAEALALADRIVVMRDGRVAQSGTPEDLYERPTSGFVARFMGFENILDVTAEGLVGEKGHLETAANAANGARALAWRPQNVVLGQGPYAGRVVGASYQGETIEYLVECTAGMLKAQSAAGVPRFVAGENLQFDLPLDRAVKLAES